MWDKWFAPRRGFGVVVVMIVLALAGMAAPLESPFFTWEVPDGWTLSRTETGLWQLEAPGIQPLRVNVTVARLRTTPQQYLVGTTRLWASLGEVRMLEDWGAGVGDQAWFLVKPKDATLGMGTLVKWVCWRESILVVSSFAFPEGSLKANKARILQLAHGLRLLRPKFHEADLREEIKRVLTRNQDTLTELSDVALARRVMNVARQDWEAFFVAEAPVLYRAYLAYLDARYEAAFAHVLGKDLGIDDETVDSRVKTVLRCRDELHRRLQGF